MKDEKKNKMEKPMTLEELSNGIHAFVDSCCECPQKEYCATFARAFAADGYLNYYRNAQEQMHDMETRDDDKDPFDENDLPAMDALNEAVADLVDSLFNVIDKVQDARRYLKQLDDLTDAALDYLSAIGVPQLDQED